MCMMIYEYIYIYIYIYMVQFLESSKEGLLKNRRPSNNRISLKNRTVFFCRPGMSLKKYSFLRTSCPELFKENSQEDATYMINPYESYGGMTIPNYGKSTSRGPPTPSYIHGMTRWFPNKKYWDFTIKHVNPYFLKPRLVKIMGTRKHPLA